MEQAPEYLTVRELAQLLRIKERKVYDLAASGQVPVSRATGKLLFPEREIRDWIDGNRTGPGEHLARPLVLLGSHDPLLEWAVRQSECGLATLLDGSTDGLGRFVAGEGVVAGLHIHDAISGEWNIPAIEANAPDRNAVLLSWATRRRGLVISNDKVNTIQLVTDLRGRRLAVRQAASGTAALMAHVLDAAGVAIEEIDVTEPMRSELDAVLAVAEGAADATFGLEALAKRQGLSFVPLVEERFDLLVDKHAYFRPSFQSLMSFCRGATFQERACAMGGYSVEDLGHVRWTAE